MTAHCRVPEVQQPLLHVFWRWDGKGMPKTAKGEALPLAIRLVDCPNGKRALGGGVSTSAPYETRVVESAPTGEAIGWGVGVKNEGGPTMSAYAWVTCASVGR